MLCQSKNANVCCNMSFVLVPSWPAARLSMAYGVQTVNSALLLPPCRERTLTPPWWHCSRRDYRPRYSAAPALCTHCPLTKIHGLAASSVQLHQICLLTFVQGKLQKQPKTAHGTYAGDTKLGTHHSACIWKNAHTFQCAHRKTKTVLLHNLHLIRLRSIQIVLEWSFQ